MTNFAGVDFYNYDSTFTPEEIAIRDTVRKFVDKEILPIIGKHFREGTSIPGIARLLGSLGVFGATLPEEYGCAGLGAVAYGLMLQELERGDSAVRSFASVQSALVMYPIFTFGSEQQKKNWLPALAKGEKVGCFGLTEPDHGSDPAGMVTTAKKTPKGFVLNGAKMWITNGTIADVAIVWAKLDGEVRGFLVEKGTKGFSAPEIKGKLSLRASITSELIFEECEIPAEHILPKSQGLKSPLMCLNQARYGISWGVIGAAMACYDEALAYAQSRIQFDKPIGSFQLVQKKLVDMVCEITKAQGLSLQLGRLKEQGKDHFTQVSLAKRNNVREAITIARVAREILGANGISDEYQAMRHANNLESVLTYEGTEDMHTLIVGEKITGIGAFR